MSRIARTLSVLALLTLPGCDPADEFADEFTDDEVSERDFDFDFDPDFDPDLDIDFDFDGFIPPIINIDSLPQFQVWATGLDSQIIVLGSSNSATEVFAFQVDRISLDIVATRRASTRSGDLRRGQAIPLRDYTGVTHVLINPALKNFMIQRQVSFGELGGNLWLELPKGPPKGIDPIFQAKVEVVMKNIMSGY